MCNRLRAELRGKIGETDFIEKIIIFIRTHEVEKWLQIDRKN